MTVSQKPTVAATVWEFVCECSDQPLTELSGKSVNSLLCLLVCSVMKKIHKTLEYIIFWKIFKGKFTANRVLPYTRYAITFSLKFTLVLELSEHTVKVRKYLGFTKAYTNNCYIICHYILAGLDDLKGYPLGVRLGLN